MDLTAEEVLDGKSWRWFTVRVFGLSPDSRAWNAIRQARKAKRSKAPITRASDIAAALR